MARTTRKHQQEGATQHEVAITGRRRKQDATNSLRFLTHIEGVTDYDGRVRGANGIRWRLA